MKKINRIVFLAVIMLSTQPLLNGAFLQQLVEAQEARGIRVTTAEQTQFENQTKNLSQQLATSPQPTHIAENNADQVSMLLSSFYTLFLDPAFITFSTKEIMNNFFDTLTTWQDALKKSTVTIPWPTGTRGEDLKTLLVQALKEICLSGRYTKHREENLVTFKLRLQHMLTSLIMDASLALWKNELVTNNEQLSLGAFYSWDVALIKSELKDSAALIPLFNKLATTIDEAGEEQAAKQHEQELALEKQQLEQRKQQEAQYLRASVVHIEQQKPTDAAGKEALYLDYIRALLDPAYQELSPKERKSIDTINDHFRRLHGIIGKHFVPVLSQSGIDALKLLVAKALETISSPALGRSGGAAFKNHIELVLKTIMTVHPNQTSTENQIKFQWIKPLYFDNQFLTADMKKKLLNIFNSDNFQRWQASIRNLTFKVASPVEAPVIAATMPMAETSTPESMPEVMPTSTSVVEEKIITERAPARDPKEHNKQHADKLAREQAKEELKERTRLFKEKREQTKAANQQAREQARQQARKVTPQ